MASLRHGSLSSLTPSPIQRSEAPERPADVRMVAKAMGRNGARSCERALLVVPRWMVRTRRFDCAAARYLNITLIAPQLTFFATVVPQSTPQAPMRPQSGLYSGAHGEPLCSVKGDTWL